ncbi:MAG: hypothetical protein ABL996_08005 [Micropepsaceae bacterium]
MTSNGVQVFIVDRLGTRLAFQLKPGMSVAIIGTDGTGKTTAAKMLADHLREAGIACERHHWYRWGQALFFVPFAVGLNRLQKRCVQIFDRTLYDNVASWFNRSRAAADHQHFKRVGWSVRIVRALAPRFDVVIFLVAAPELIVKRRPEISLDEARRAVGVYNQIGSVLGLVPLDQIGLADRFNPGS